MLKLSAALALLLAATPAFAQQLCSAVAPTEQNCPVRPGDIERHCSFQCSGDPTWYFDTEGKIVMSAPGVRAMRTDTCTHVLEFYIQDCAVRPETGVRPRYCPPGHASDGNPVFSSDQSVCRPKWNPNLGK